jgi:hypothetical protein
MHENQQKISGKPLTIKTKYCTRALLIIWIRYHSKGYDIFFLMRSCTERIIMQFVLEINFGWLPLCFALLLITSRITRLEKNIVSAWRQIPGFDTKITAVHSRIREKKKKPVLKARSWFVFLVNTNDLNRWGLGREEKKTLLKFILITLYWITPGARFHY